MKSFRKFIQRLAIPDRTLPQRSLPLIVLALVFLFGLFLHLFALEKFVWHQSGFDESRDMLVAEHLVRYGEHITQGPLAAGGFHWLKNSPVYYYLVAAVWSLSQNPVVFMVLWAIIMSSKIVIAFAVGRQMWDSKLGLILAALAATSPLFLHHIHSSSILFVTTGCIRS